MLGDERAEVVRRLRTIGVSLCSIHTLVETGAPSGIILRQICTVQSDLRDLKIQMLECQLAASTKIMKFSPSTDDRLIQLQRFFDLYSILLLSA